MSQYHQPRLLADGQHLQKWARQLLRLSFQQSEMVGKSGVLFAGSTRMPMTSSSRLAIRRENATSMQ